MRAKPVRWGPWTLNRRALVLWHKSSRTYQIPLERMTSPAAVLHWLAHLSAKSKRFTAEDIGHFFRALDEIFDFEDYYLRGEQDATVAKPITEQWIVERVRTLPKRRAGKAAFHEEMRRLLGPARLAAVSARADAPPAPTPTEPKPRGGRKR